MTEVDELLARLRRLQPMALEDEFAAQLRARGRRRLRRSAPAAPLASLAVLGTVVVYLAWALHFASALYP